MTLIKYSGDKCVGKGQAHGWSHSIGQNESHDHVQFEVGGQVQSSFRMREASEYINSPNDYYTAHWDT